jgi:hypothetical protein
MAWSTVCRDCGNGYEIQGHADGCPRPPAAVYTLDFDVLDGDDDSLLSGYRTVHASMESAERELVERLAEFVPAAGIMPVTVGTGHRLDDAGSDGTVYRRLVSLGVMGYDDPAATDDWANTLEISSGIVNDDSHCADLFDCDVRIVYGINRMPVKA